MNIGDFVESMKLDKHDFCEFDKNRHYYQAVVKILQKNFDKLSPEERPLHRALPVVNKPASFFIRDKNKWKEECHSMINHEIKYIEEFESEEEQMAMTKFLEKFGEKIFEKYTELRDSDAKWQDINQKMMRGGTTQDKIDMLDLIVESNLLILDTNQKKIIPEPEISQYVNVPTC